jgi:hypothetical protein
MDDDRVRKFETALWVGGDDVYRQAVDPGCLMVLPEPPFLMSAAEAIEAVSRTPRWRDVELLGLRIARPHEGLIVIAYEALASREGEAFSANCTSTYVRIAHEEWRVVQHQQSIPPAAPDRQDAAKTAGGDMEQAQRQAAERREDEHGYQ